MAKNKRIGQVVGLVVGLTLEDTTAAIAILDRLKLVADVNSDTELASALGLKYSSISSAKARGMVPTAWIINTANLFNVSADWLIFGDDRHPDRAPTKGQQPPAESQPPVEKIANNDKQITEEWALALSLADFEDLWDEYRQEREARRGWLQVEVIKRFPEFLEWLKNRPAPLRPPHPATLKKDEPTFHYGLPAAPPED